MSFFKKPKEPKESLLEYLKGQKRRKERFKKIDEWLKAKGFKKKDNPCGSLSALIEEVNSLIPEVPKMKPEEFEIFNNIKQFKDDWASNMVARNVDCPKVSTAGNTQGGKRTKRRRKQRKTKRRRRKQRRTKQRKRRRKQTKRRRRRR